MIFNALYIHFQFVPLTRNVRKVDSLAISILSDFLEHLDLTWQSIPHLSSGNIHGREELLYCLFVIKTRARIAVRNCTRFNKNEKTEDKQRDRGTSLGKGRNSIVTDPSHSIKCHLLLFISCHFLPILRSQQIQLKPVLPSFSIKDIYE